jgi:hypothetical protein
VLAAMALFFVTGAIIQYFNGNRNATAAVTGASQAGHPLSGSAAVSSADDSLSKSVEVSGLRLVPGWTHKQQVTFLVINHSSASIPAISILMAVRPADSSSASAPILNINAVIRSLGPYQSKEIRTDLDSGIPASTFADWQSLRTDIQISSSQ